MGHYQQRELGDDYIAVALTHTADHVPEMYLDQTSLVGFTIQNAPLGSPQAASLARRTDSSRLRPVGDACGIDIAQR